MGAKLLADALADLGGGLAPRSGWISRHPAILTTARLLIHA
jgi:hypothetical protein